MDKTWICSCGHYEWHENTGEDLEDFGPSAWYHNWPCDGGDYNNNIFCFKCGDQLLPDGRVIQRESVPNRLMDMLKEVQDTCPKNGLQEFALKCLNWIEEMREQAGLTGEWLSNNAGINRGAYKEFTDNCLNSPGAIYLSTLFKLLNAAQKAQEATDGNPQ